jgi:hypothetical protein
MATFHRNCVCTTKDMTRVAPRRTRLDGLGPEALRESAVTESLQGHGCELLVAVAVPLSA